MKPSALSKQGPMYLYNATEAQIRMLAVPQAPNPKT